MSADLMEAKPANSRRWIWIVLGVVVLAGIAVLLWVLLSKEPPPAPPEDAGQPDAARADASPDAHDAAPADVAAEAPPKKAHTYRGHRLVTSAELRRLLRRHAGVIRYCYRRASRRLSSSAPRRANVVVDLAGGGRIRSVRVSASGNAALAACVRRAVLGFRFPRAAKQQFVRFPVVVPR
ncbi:MAG: hypothetical protein KC503_27950 [Myxococcales bacterium]|nr:hypothetical protein [Myxococcales bacterium]